MSAQPQPLLNLRILSLACLDDVLEIETRAYEFPWSRDNFLSSWTAGYWMQGLWLNATPSGAAGPNARLAGYLVAMEGVDELHLLNLTVDPRYQSQGLGTHMLQALREHAWRSAAGQIWLEVRVSNLRAQALYRRHGFRDVHVRKRYYPAAQDQREDAQIMCLSLSSRENAP